MVPVGKFYGRPVTSRDNQENEEMYTQTARICSKMLKVLGDTQQRTLGIQPSRIEATGKDRMFDKPVRWL